MNSYLTTPNNANNRNGKSIQHKGIRALQLWAHQRIVKSGHPEIQKIDDMTRCWRDGLAFCGLIHSFDSHLLPTFHDMKAKDVRINNELAFTIAEEELAIPRLLDSCDMAKCSEPDRFSVITYVSQFYHRFKELNSFSSSPISSSVSSLQPNSESLRFKLTRPKSLHFSSRSKCGAISTTHDPNKEVNTVGLAVKTPQKKLTMQKLQCEQVLCSPTLLSLIRLEDGLNEASLPPDDETNLVIEDSATKHLIDPADITTTTSITTVNTEQSYDGDSSGVSSSRSSRDQSVESEDIALHLQSCISESSNNNSCGISYINSSRMLGTNPSSVSLNYGSCQRGKRRPSCIPESVVENGCSSNEDCSNETDDICSNKQTNIEKEMITASKDVQLQEHIHYGRMVSESQADVEGSVQWKYGIAKSNFNRNFRRTEVGSDDVSQTEKGNDDEIKVTKKIKSDKIMQLCNLFDVHRMDESRKEQRL